MRIDEFDYEILKNAMSKIPDDFKLEQIVFDNTSFKILTSVDTSSDFALKRADELFKIQMQYKDKI